MSDIDGQSMGAEGAEESQGVTDPAPAPEPEISNKVAKSLPWVKELMSKAAELDQLKTQQAEAAARAEREKAEAEGRYNDALEMEKKAREADAAKYAAEVKALKLETEFTRQGLVDPRAIRLFESEYDPGTMDASEFVATIKADGRNSMYFVDPNQRKPRTPPHAANGQPDTFDPERDLDSWLSSSDEKKRARAIAHNREKYDRQLRKK